MNECKKCVEKYCADWHDYCECDEEWIRRIAPISSDFSHL